MALSSLTLTVQRTINWSGSVAVTGLASGAASSNLYSKTWSYGTAKANAAAAGADELYFALLTVAGSGNTTLDLTSFTDVVLQATVALVRVKMIDIQLMALADTAPDNTTAGTACSSITVGNGSNPFAFGFSAATTTFDIDNGGCRTFNQGAGAGFTVDGAHKIIKFLNNDSGNSAKILVTIGGGTT